MRSGHFGACGEKGELERMERLLLGRHQGKELCGVGICACSMSVMLPHWGALGPDGLQRHGDSRCGNGLPGGERDNGDQERRGHKQNSLVIPTAPR